MKKEVITIVDEPLSETVTWQEPGVDGNGQPVLIDRSEVRTWTERRQVVTLVDMTPEEVAAFEAERSPDLVAYAAAKRWAKASGGITVPLPGGGTLALPSDDVAYGRLKGAAQDLAAGIITEPITIVIGATVVQATQALAQSLYAAISQHWQACYTIQGQVVAAIQAGTITTTAQIDAMF